MQLHNSQHFSCSCCKYTYKTQPCTLLPWACTCLTLTSAMPDPAAAGATSTVSATLPTTRLQLMSTYTQYEANACLRSSKVRVAQNLKPAMFSTPKLTAKAAAAVMIPKQRTGQEQGMQLVSIW